MRRFVQPFSSDGGFPSGFPSPLLEALIAAPDRDNIGDSWVPAADGPVSSAVTDGSVG